MRFALVNPPWSFEGSIYFGCREPHLPLELNYSKALLEASGHEAEIIDGQLQGLSSKQIFDRVQSFGPDFTVITTAPSYLFWRCAPPEIRIPMELSQLLRPVAGRIVVVGPHGSTTPRPVLRKLGADYVVLGECEEVLPFLRWRSGFHSVRCIPARRRNHRSRPESRFGHEEAAQSAMAGR